VARWLKNPTYNARDMGSISDQGNKIPHASERLSLQVDLTQIIDNRTRRGL